MIYTYTAYNIISSVFRGLGDSKSPMYFIAVACAANIALDILFIGPIALGPVGAALGTTLSQTLSVIVALFGIRRHKTGLRLSRQNFRPRKGVLGRILKIGLPVAVQDGCIQVAFIIITIIANHRGLIDSAAVGIVEKIISAMFIVPSSMLATVSALSSQNLGAGKPERAAQTLKYAAMIATGYGIAVVLVIELVAEPLLGCFTTDAAVVLMGCQYIRGYIVDTIFVSHMENGATAVLALTDSSIGKFAVNLNPDGRVYIAVHSGHGFFDIGKGYENPAQLRQRFAHELRWFTDMIDAFRGV